MVVRKFPASTGSEVGLTENYVSLSAAACGVLHNVFYLRPSELYLIEIRDCGLLDYWPGFSAGSSQAIDSIKHSLIEDTVHEIERDYYRLFIGPGGMWAYPWGSVYTDRENQVFGETTQAFKDFCRRNGVEFSLEHAEPPDHVGLILGVLSVLFAAMEESGNPDFVAELMRDHLLPWLDRFTALVEEHATTGYFCGFVALLAGLVYFWAERLDITPLKRHLYL